MIRSAEPYDSRPSDRIGLVRLPARLALVGALVVLNSAVYLALNARSLANATLMRPTLIDRFIGWHAWAIWPYWALLLLGPALAIGISHRAVLERSFKAYGVAVALNVLVWTAWPTWIERHALPPDLSSATAHAWQLLLAIDRAGNCLPSGHVTIPVVIAVGFARQYPQRRLQLTAVIALLIPSVIATGQHTAWDVVAGIATAAAGWALTQRRSRGARLTPA